MVGVEGLEPPTLNPKARAWLSVLPIRLHAFGGGAGNCTRVQSHFSSGVYVRSQSFSLSLRSGSR